MTNQPTESKALARIATPRGEITLDIPTIIRYLCPEATQQEAFMFLKLCEGQGLNPFLREAYLIKYSKDRPATMVVGKDTFTQRAEQNQQFDGFRAGIVVVRGETIQEVEGAILAKGDVLLGGWAEVYRKDHKLPCKVTADMSEYSTGMSNWKKMPATMIRKVALVQALREAFPTAFAGLYDAAEMKTEIPDDASIDPEGPVTAAGPVRTAPPATRSPAPRPEAKTPPVETTARPAETPGQATAEMFPPESKAAAPAAGGELRDKGWTPRGWSECYGAIEYQFGIGPTKAKALADEAGRGQTPQDMWAFHWKRWEASRAPAPKGGAS